MSRTPFGPPQFYPPVPQPYFPPKISDDVLKVGVQIDPELTRFLPIDLAGKMPQLTELDQKEPLGNIVKGICSKWNFETPENFALRFTKPNRYITEKNRNEIVNGDVFTLSISPSKLSSVILDRLAQYQPPLVTTLFEQTVKALFQSSGDPAYVEEFVGQGGLSRLAGFIETGSFQLTQQCSKTEKELLASFWSSFWKLMETSATSWDTLSEAFIGQMANYVLGRSKSEHPEALSVALAILEAVVNSSCNSHIVEQNVQLEGLIKHLENSDSSVQQQTLALMNALFAKVDRESQRLQTATLLHSKPVRSAIMNNVLRDRSFGIELTHQLHVFQRILLNVWVNRAWMKPCPEDVNAFCKLAMNIVGGWSSDGNGAGAMSPPSARRNAASPGKDYKKLGFKSLTNPIEDFEQMPPGLLSLDCFAYFAKHHPDKLAKIIIENSCRTDGRDYPFVQASLHVICHLLTLLNCGETPQDDGGSFYEVLFTSEFPFEELASHVLVLFSRTWKETRALFPDDLCTVLHVVDEQVRRSLNERPRTFEQLDEFMRRYSYSEIARLRENERSLKEKSEFESTPIIELQQKLRPEMLLLVRANRLNGIKEGQTFVKYTRGMKGAREKGKFWHWKLSPTEQCLLYEECDEKHPPNVEDMKSKIMIPDIERIAVGADCPHVAREPRKKGVPILAFSIFLNNECGSENDCFNFLAPSMPTYNLWIDGLFALLNQPMPSIQASEDVDMLLNMEIKVRLLDLEDSILPSSPPPIPPLPPNFNF